MTNSTPVDPYRAANVIADRCGLPDDDPCRALWWRPWTDEQVRLLTAHQRSRRFHPYTCDTSSHRPLEAWIGGWRCLDCAYTQDWARPIEGTIAEVLLHDVARLEGCWTCGACDTHGDCEHRHDATLTCGECGACGGCAQDCAALGYLTARRDG